MYKLTIEFKTLEELQAFSNKLGGTTYAPTVQDMNEVKEAKKSAAPKAPKAAAKTQEAELPPAIGPATQITTGNKEALLAHATALVDKLKKSGIAENQIMPTINGAFQTAGIPVGQRISALDEQSLVKFMPIFEAAVNSIIGAPKGHSFI